MQDQLTYYQQKLQYETDSWDVSEAINKGEDIVVIDARSPEAYQQEHIPGAINLPHRTMNEESTRDFKVFSPSRTAAWQGSEIWVGNPKKAELTI